MHKEGQLHPEERAYLQEVIQVSKPNVSLECGTWKGWGSTLSIFKGLQHNGQGVLYSFEVYEPFYSQAVQSFADVEDSSTYLNFFLEDFIKGVKNLGLSSVDFCFFDGPEDGDYSYEAFLLVDSLMEKGDMCFHDWKTEKCRRLRELVESEEFKENHEVTVLDSEVGFCHVKKLGPKT
tara:strand:+ start:412 stop:945 length:534 start_codon:yes stop_codon:yes gene_type:complete